ncbi:MAG TPA: glycine cleavage T C-terminal barrel domain-containing protein [Bryobacteraceae bacterium]|nr:glycine cleavage T C-terminal barrel domain-containing protein [Bryobacteraceae bacterium]
MTGYEALRNHTAWIDLGTRAEIRVTGEDRARLLHAMSTNHVQGLAPSHGLYAFFLNDKGRILADACIYNLGDSFLLDTEPELGEKLREHLERYIIADDANLEDETGHWSIIGLEGPQSLANAATLAIPIPEQPYSIVQWKQGFVARVASASRTGIRIFTPAGQTAAFPGIPQATAKEARIVRIENGIPRYGEEITERYLVQETQILHAIHSNKGCYLGQEIVERVRSRGQVHRVLAPVRIKTNTPPEAGTKLTVDGNNVAEIASAVYSPALGEVAALAYVRTEAAHAKPEMIVAGSEPPIPAYVS